MSTLNLTITSPVPDTALGGDYANAPLPIAGHVTLMATKGRTLHGPIVVRVHINNGTVVQTNALPNGNWSLQAAPGPEVPPCGSYTISADAAALLAYMVVPGEPETEDVTASASVTVHR